MNKIILSISLCFYGVLAFAQVDPVSANAFADGFTPSELEHILNNVPYKKHEKWMKGEGYTYDKSQSTSEYFFYDKNGVVRFALYHRNSEITQVLAISSPQKYYQALSKLKEDKKYRLVKETVGDIGKGKFMKEAQWIKGELVYKASSDQHYITVYRDFEGMASKPTIKAFDDNGASSGASADMVVNNLQYFLKTVGGAYPKAGEDYNGAQRVTQDIKNLNLSGRVEIEKARLAVDCKSVSSFNVREKVSFDLQDVTGVVIHTYTSGNAKTYAVCIIVKNWDKTGVRSYDKMEGGSSKPCKFPGKWETGRKTASYVRPIANTAIAFEFTDEKWANQCKSFFETAVRAAQ
jgi:hypothetical protein